jgi:hypothetical protein
MATTFAEGHTFRVPLQPDRGMKRRYNSMRSQSAPIKHRQSTNSTLRLISNLPEIPLFLIFQRPNVIGGSLDFRTCGRILSKDWSGERQPNGSTFAWMVAQPS